MTQDLFLRNTPQVKTDELTSISVNNVLPCQYVTESAFFNLAGIQNNDLNNVDQIETRETSTGLKIEFNFCENDIPTTDNCTDSEAFAFIEDTKECYGIRSEDNKIDTTGTEIRNEDG